VQSIDTPRVALISPSAQMRTKHQLTSPGHAAYTESVKMIAKKLAFHSRMRRVSACKVPNHAAAISLHYMHYNFCRIHKDAARHARDGGGLDHVWEISEIVDLLEARERAV
jgi:hypothetical protein